MTASLLLTSVGAAGPRSAAVPNAKNATPATAAELQRNAEIAALRSRVKYVFVLYQENRSFDSYFGTFPGAEGIYSNPPGKTPGFAEQILNTDGVTYSTVTPFRLGPKEYAADTDDVNHSHPVLLQKMDITSYGPQMDKYALAEEETDLASGYTALQAKQLGELTMAYEDCDTIPLLWNYAHRFTLYDHIFQSAIGPSTPGNLTVLSAQTGETQYGLHPSEGYTDNGGSLPGVPVMNDNNPAWGPGAGHQINLTYATLPVTLAGKGITAIAASDPSRATDFADLGADVSTVQRDPMQFGWGWYQNGYESATAANGNYIAHHNAPQYFGYLANSSERNHLHGLPNFVSDVSKGTLPPQGGVFYVKGGYTNILGLLPVDPNPAVQTDFPGDDDHPGYSDAQISEAQVASAVNAIVQSKYWGQSAIVISWDDSEGDHDHVVPPITAIGPGTGNSPEDFITDGPRVPLIVISPFAKTGAVVHSYGTQSSIVKLVDQVFGLTPLAQLPDEVAGAAGAAALGKVNYVPGDGTTNGATDLLDAFDYGRLTGKTAPLPPAYAYVPPALVTTLPQASGLGCAQIGVIPVDYLRGVANHIPSDFDPRPIEDETPTAPSARTRVQRAKDPED